MNSQLRDEVQAEIRSGIRKAAVALGSFLLKVGVVVLLSFAITDVYLKMDENKRSHERTADSHKTQINVLREELRTLRQQVNQHKELVAEDIGTLRKLATEPRRPAAGPSGGELK